MSLKMYASTPDGACAIGLDQHHHVIGISRSAAGARDAEDERGVLGDARRCEDDSVLIAGVQRHGRAGCLGPGQRLAARDRRPRAHRGLAARAHGLIAARNDRHRSGRSRDVDRRGRYPCRPRRIDERHTERVASRGRRIEADRLRFGRQQCHRRATGLLPQTRCSVRHVQPATTAPAVRPTATVASATTLNVWAVLVQVGLGPVLAGGGAGAGPVDEESPPPQPPAPGPRRATRSPESGGRRVVMMNAAGAGREGAR